MTKNFGWKPAIFACAVVALALSSPARASSITWQFDYKISNAAPHDLIGPGNYGSITLTDSVNDPFRVDISITATPASGSRIEMFFLNFVSSLPAIPKWYLVPQVNVAGDTTPSAGSWVVNFNNKEVLNTGFMFDFLSGPTGSPGSLSFSGSIALFDHDTSLSSRVDLNVSDFVGTSVGGTAPLYAAYTANDAGGNQGYGALATTNRSIDAVPEPASLLLFGSGLLGAGVRIRRRLTGK